jgi:threonine 3-dehydrogenase
MPMKAIAKTRPAFGAEIIDLPEPRPGEGELLVRISACGICGSDLHLYEWELGADRMVTKMPFVMGHEPSGEVVSVGARVTGFKPGDRVALDPLAIAGDAVRASAARFICVRRRRIFQARSPITRSRRSATPIAFPIR